MKFGNMDTIGINN